jgi:hypothetical protein
MVKGSHLIKPLLEPNAWAVLPAEGEAVETGDLIPVYGLRPGF